jgi:hypothetical protein
LAKGLKMEAAKKKSAGNRIFNISQLSRLDNGNLKCKFCDIEVQYVSAHTKKSSRTPVAAYLKLWQDSDYKEGCGYSVKIAVDELVAQSNVIEDISPIFELQEDRSYLFRMNILIEAQRVAQELSDVETNNIERQSSGRNYVRSEQHLASYFRSASGIAKLRSLILESSDVELLTQLVKIKYKDSSISWNDFYYDETRYHILFNRLTKGNLPYPVAVNVIIREESEYYKAAKRFHWSCQCYCETTQINAINRLIIPTLRLAEERLASQFSSDNKYLVVGEVWASKVTREEFASRYFNISIFHKSQFMKEIDVQ